MANTMQFTIYKRREIVFGAQKHARILPDKELIVPRIASCFYLHSAILAEAKTISSSCNFNIKRKCKQKFDHS